MVGPKNKEDKKEKLKGLILGILSFTGKIPKVKLGKLVLFTEIEHFRKTGDSFTGLYFVRLKKGPLIAFFDEILDEEEGKLWEKETEMIPIYEEGRAKKQYSYAPLIKKKLSIDLKTTIKKVDSKYGRMTGTQLSLESHSLPAWRYSEPNEPIYVAELAVINEEEYFALTDLIEDIEEDDEFMEKELSQYLQSTESRI